MKFLLLGKGNSIKYIKKYIKKQNDEIVHAVFEHEYNGKYVLADERLLELNDIDYAIKSPGISETNQLYLKLSLKFKFIENISISLVVSFHIYIIFLTPFLR